MLTRFCLYGFLKNQRYFEPWMLLAFRAKGVSFTEWGVLVGFREVLVNLFEVPSGAVADAFGRRLSMMVSFVAYIVSFCLLGAGNSMFVLFVGMAFFAFGDAFRTGTHKAMIFSWLKRRGREKEKTEVYGYTRSWSKLGSAFSVVVASVFVFFSGNYEYTFYLTALPYLAGLINFTAYPAELDGDLSAGRKNPGAVVLHLKEAFHEVFRRAALRRIVFESMGFEGLFKVVKDYLQPVLLAAATTWFASCAFAEELLPEQKTAILAGPVFFVLYLLSAAASRRAHLFAEWSGGEDNGARRLWAAFFATFAVLAPALYFNAYAVVIAGFVSLYVLQNIWRPLLVSRFDNHASPGRKATSLSIESQAKSMSTMILAPVLGYLVDLLSSGSSVSFWAVGAFGAVLSLCFVLLPPVE